VKGPPPDEKARAENAGHFAQTKFSRSLLAQSRKRNAAAVRSRSSKPKKTLDHRRCRLCKVRVDNSNLGGNSGNSALTGPLFCLRCADGAEVRP